MWNHPFYVDLYNELMSLDPPPLDVEAVEYFKKFDPDGMLKELKSKSPNLFNISATESCLQLPIKGIVCDDHKLSESVRSQNLPVLSFAEKFKHNLRERSHIDGPKSSSSTLKGVFKLAQPNLTNEVVNVDEDQSLAGWILKGFSLPLSKLLMKK